MCAFAPERNTDMLRVGRWEEDGDGRGEESGDEEEVEQGGLA